MRAALRPHSERSAFTLIELLAVLGVIAILAGILIPAISNSMARARDVRCQSNLRQLMSGVQLYASVNNGDLLSSHGSTGRWDKQLIEGGFLDDEPDAIICPERPITTNQAFNYAMNGRLGTGVYSIGITKIYEAEKPSATMLLIDARQKEDNAFITVALPPGTTQQGEWGAHNGGQTINILYLDGHVGSGIPTELPSSLQAEGGDIFWAGKKR
jgi:prepilin-type N-terminal cleavage/methylation domain-containing protein/prepilin-type processing-associated H-X9-DG protein